MFKVNVFKDINISVFIKRVNEETSNFLVSGVVVKTSVVFVHKKMGDEDKEEEEEEIVRYFNKFIEF